MLLALIYGVYIIFFESPEQTEAVAGSGDWELEVLNKFITKIADKTKSGLSKKQSYVLEKARVAWEKDPLIQLEAKKVVDTGPVLGTGVQACSSSTPCRARASRAGVGTGPP